MPPLGPRPQCEGLRKKWFMLFGLKLRENKRPEERAQKAGERERERGERGRGRETESLILYYSRMMS